MANDSGPSADFSFNNPVYCDWTVEIIIEAENNDAEEQGNDDIDLQLREMQISEEVKSKDRSFLVSSIKLAKHSEYFRYFELAVSFLRVLFLV